MGDQTIWGGGAGGQEDGIAMKGAQSKIKWGEGTHGVNGGHTQAPPPPIVTPLRVTKRTLRDTKYSVIGIFIIAYIYWNNRHFMQLKNIYISFGAIL